jgi:hypothetical protein
MMEPTERVVIVSISSDDFVGRFIRWALHSKYNHSYILYESHLWSGWWAADIMPEGVVKRAAEKSMKRKALDIRFHECLAPLNSGLEKARRLVGAGYDWKGLFFNLIRFNLARFFKINWLKPAHRLDKLFCSEFVALVIQWSGVKSFAEVDPSMISPQEIFDILEGDEHFVQVPNPLADDDGVVE